MTQILHLTIPELQAMQGLSLEARTLYVFEIRRYVGPDDAALIEDLCDQILALVKDRKPLPKPVVVGDVMTVEQAMELTGSRTYWQLVRAAGYKTPSIVPNWKAAGRVPDRVAKMIRDKCTDAVVAQMVGEVAA